MYRLMNEFLNCETMKNLWKACKNRTSLVRVGLTFKRVLRCSLMMKLQNGIDGKRLYRRVRQLLWNFCYSKYKFMESKLK